MNQLIRDLNGVVNNTVRYSSSTMKRTQDVWYRQRGISINYEKDRGSLAVSSIYVFLYDTRYETIFRQFQSRHNMVFDLTGKRFGFEHCLIWKGDNMTVKMLKDKETLNITAVVVEVDDDTPLH